MSLELTGVHGLLKRHKLFTHKTIILQIILLCVNIYVFINKRNSQMKIKERYINEWLEIQKEENNVDKI